MQPVVWTLDLPLLVSLVALAAGALSARELFTSVALFIAFGLLMALTWARLGAVDIALAEAAIGAGLTGALLMLTLRCVEGTAGVGNGRGSAADKPLSRSTRPFVSVVLGCMAGMLLILFALATGAAVWWLPREMAGLSAVVETQLPRSGVKHAVTAVLLNFRGYDTLWELAVLLLAALGVQLLRAQRGPSATAFLPSGPSSDPVLQGLIRVAAPLIVLLSFYLLWLGAHAPGGAFQGGALLGAGSVLLFLGAAVTPRRTRGLVARILVSVGLLGFVTTGIAAMLLGGRFLQYPPGWAKPLILGIEFVAMLSIAAVFASLFAALLPGEIPAAREGDPPEDTP